MLARNYFGKSSAVKHTNYSGFLHHSGITLMAPSHTVDGTDTSGSGRRRTGSLALFFRKVYHLAHLRLDLLCHTLEIAEEDSKRKIWTVFEYTVRYAILLKSSLIKQVYSQCPISGQVRLSNRPFCLKPEMDNRMTV
jgi:hypothetical protein